MALSVLGQATLINVLFYVGALAVMILVCRWVLRHEATRGTAWFAGAGLLLAVSPWLLDGVLPAVDPDWARGPAPTAEMRTFVWSDRLVGVAVSVQQPRRGGAELSRVTYWRSPARTLLAFLALVGAGVALGTFPGGPRFVLGRTTALVVRVGDSASASDAR
jgi:hypothetical protein